MRFDSVRIIPASDLHETFDANSSRAEARVLFFNSFIGALTLDKFV